MLNKKLNSMPAEEPEIHISGSFISEFPANDDLYKFEPSDAPVSVLPLENEIAFPGMPHPVKILDEEMEKFLDKAFSDRLTIMAITPKEGVENPHTVKDFFPVGVLAKVIKIIKMPGSIPVAFITAGPRARLKKMARKSKPLSAYVEILPDPTPLPDDKEVEILLNEIFDIFSNILNYLPDQEKERLKFSIDEMDADIMQKVMFMSLNSPLSIEDRNKLLEQDSAKGMLETFLRLLNLASQKLEIQAKIQQRTHLDLNRRQRDEFLKQQIKAIQNELNDETDSDDLTELSKRGEKINWSKEAKSHFDKELSKLERLSVQSPDYSVQYAYLDNLLSLPWDNYSPDNFSLEKVEEILDRDHYGLENVKERILEQMAVIKLRGDMKAPILCLYGPPGVGKTSLGKSVADALGREYVRVSFGGLHDEAEIRGHRRTYIGAMPGRILSALMKCGTGNPVFVLDEIDKIGKDFKGDPSTALLEVLDPEQNVKFHDNYIDFDYDLSKILFIATANSLSEISRPLLDRMEIIEIGGYIPEEKVEIAKRHLVKKSLKEHGFSEDEFSFSDDALRYIVDRYTRESGVRQLEKKIAKVLRKLARRKASGKEYPHEISVDYVKELLGKEEVNPDKYESNRFAGVVTGLAWTQVGGEILFIESSLSQGNGEKLTLTGNLGDVMKESAVIALQYLKAHALHLGIDPQLFSKKNVHIHVPEGAIPKDGPSAGVTMATSLASAFTGRKVREKLAMTGEITLRGKVLPVGGIKEKILAAKRAGISDIVLSNDNRKDIEEINSRYLEGLTFHYVDTIEDVLNIALLSDLAEFNFNSQQLQSRDTSN